MTLNAEHVLELLTEVAPRHLWEEILAEARVLVAESESDSVEED